MNVFWEEKNVEILHLALSILVVILEADSMNTLSYPEYSVNEQIDFSDTSPQPQQYFFESLIELGIEQALEDLRYGENAQVADEAEWVLRDWFEKQPETQDENDLLLGNW